ncbi:Ribonuclease H domain [Dillenia turbinata]|uniref:Ribonuclease H domain n=1 Tax=Dillenia turbinata TaxID=194707 RepID=A0AAN8VPB1_9MAGN
MSPLIYAPSNCSINPVCGNAASPASSSLTAAVVPPLLHYVLKQNNTQSYAYFNTCTLSYGMGKANAGTIFRDNKGRWIHGFWINIGIASPVMVEVWGLREGLKIARKNGSKNIEIETDSAILAKVLSKGVDTNHSMEILVQEFKEDMLEVNASSVKHIFRETNRCTVMLVKFDVAPGVLKLRYPLQRRWS